ncbi:glycosyltransferase family protein [Paenibacillus sp.]|uniref:glycosyltransferase family protein n=1 Tax=Paenibacillus sp. TaxID=58172 RepID=UPI00282EAC1C|nr:glycosyltransferase family protein [Paenibacillus sp.]MDR0268654.1 glycosyltransferase family protein [Paenibacillus sp.]
MQLQTFLFVLCVNNDALYQNACRQIDNLFLPPGYKKEIMAIRDACSMASAYNRALEHQAKFKIYIHQDTFIVHQGMLFELVDMFLRHPELGLIGLVGCETLPDNGIWWEGEGRAGQVIEHRGEMYQLLRFEQGFKESEDYIQVQAIDGFFMATQYDVPWIEEVFDGFHFYDTSQSMEFQLAGYTVGVPVLQSPWCIHYCGDDFDAFTYEKYRTSFVNHYFSDRNLIDRKQ